MSETILTIFSIVLIDIVLGGDNAVVIAMASRSLPEEQRRLAILWGTAGAVGLRFVFAAVATILLQIPYLMMAGGLLLMWIAYKLLVGESEHQVSAAGSLGRAIRTIIIADGVMSLDNALAVAGIAKGHIGWLAFGIMLSVPIIIFGSQFIARVMNRYPIIVYLGAAILAWTAGHLIAEDPFLLRIIGEGGVLIASILSVVLVLGAGIAMRKRPALVPPNGTSS